MLQQILKDMYIDPDVLDALSEDQKKTLFLKMRQEQVRRWKEREEKSEREGGLAEALRIRPKRANAKSVTWQLGRDGDIAVVVIGEVDEFKTSKIICSGFGEKKVPVLHSSASPSAACLKSNLAQRSTVEPARKENQPPKTPHTAPPNHKESMKEASALPPLQVSLSERVSPPAVEKSQLNPSSAPGDSPLPPATTICHHLTTKTGVINVRPAALLAAMGTAKASVAKVKPVVVPTDPDSQTNLAAAIAAAADLPVPTPPPRACYQQLRPQKATTQEPRRRDDVAVAALPVMDSPMAAGTCGGRGRVAQLMKTFNAENPSAPGQAAAAAAARSPKPPLPSKPSHLRLMKSSTVRGVWLEITAEPYSCGAGTVGTVAMVKAAVGATDLPESPHAYCSCPHTRLIDIEQLSGARRPQNTGPQRDQEGVLGPQEGRSDHVPVYQTAGASQV